MCIHHVHKPFRTHREGPAKLCVFTYDVELCNSMSDATAVASDASVLSCVSCSDIADDKRTIGHLEKPEKAQNIENKEKDMQLSICHRSGVTKRILDFIVLHKV